MSAGQFQRRLHGAKYAGNDLKYFPLWVRRYAQSVEAYRDLVLGTEEPSLGEIRQALQRVAERERDEAATGAAGASVPGVADESHLVGLIDPNEPKCLQEMRREMRLRRKALETERAYAGWISRFMRHCGGERRRHHVSEDYDARNQKPNQIRISKSEILRASLVRPTSRSDRPGRNRASSHIATNGDMATRQSLTADPASGAG